ncbi:hypothetical protein J5I95_22610 [Candidatus Poribacteria bacterium]|nr:hypothetical protein [Candidatus Poribacteria bacterium]
MGPEYGHQLDDKRNFVLDETGNPVRIRLPHIVFDNGKVFADYIESPQQRFLDDMSKFRCVVGQVGCGKSAMASAEALYHSYCYKNNLGFILMKSMRQMDVAAVRSFKEVCPRRLVWRESDEHVLLLNYAGIDFMKSGGKFLPKKQQEARLEEIGGLSTIVYTSFEGTRAALKKWASANIGWYMIDQAEESDIKLYKMLLHRLRKSPSSRQAWFIANLREDLPLESLWIWKFSSPESPQQLSTHSYMEMHTHMNEKNLPQDFLDSLEEGLDETEYAHYVSGDKDKIGMTKAVFTEFSPITNVIKHVDPPDSWEKGIGLDVGLSNPTAFVQVAKLPTGELYVYEEFKEKGEVSSYYAKQILARRTEKHRLFAIDATAGNRSRVTLTSEIDEYLRWGLPFQPATRDVMAGLNRIREYMKFNPTRFNPFTNQPGSSMLFISDRCQELIREIQQYRYDESKSVGFVNEPEKVRDYDNHLVDALRFIVVMMSVALTAASNVNAIDVPQDTYNPNVKRSKFKVTESGNLSFEETFAEALRMPVGNPSTSNKKRYTSSWTSPPVNPNTGVIVPGSQLPSPKSKRSIYTSTWMEKR